MTGPDATTLGVYNTRADDYADQTLGKTVETRLSRFIQALPPGAPVLDFGCGPGWAAAAMREAGLAVTALDASPEMARVARERYGLGVQVADFAALDAETEFDGVWAHFSLLHAPRAAFPGHLARLRQALKPGGLLLIGMKLGEGEARDRLDRFYSYYSEDELRALLAAAGFTVTGAEHETVPGFDGTPSPSVVLTATAD